MTTSYLRGHKIEFVNNRWQYCDTGEPTVKTWTKRGCGHCGLPDTPEGHDGCLGTLDENIVMNACCGHGRDSSAYVQFWSGSCIRGEEAIDFQNKLKQMK